MNGRRALFVLCAFGFIAVAAQYVWPQWTGFHRWEYATALFVVALLIGNAAIGAVREREGRSGLWRGLAHIGGLVALIAGISSSLLGPDSQTLSRAPGTVLPLPDVAIAAAFPIAGAQTIALGDATIDLRKRDHSVEPLAVGHRAFIGAFELEAVPQPAAFIRARTPSGRRTTITQPAGSAFLSPVLLFATRVKIGQNDLPADSFAVPAMERTLKAVYFPAASLALARGHGAVGTKDALLLVADDPSGKLRNGGIGLASSGSAVMVGGVVIAPTLGTYPALVVSSVPFPAAVGLGFALFLTGAVLSRTATRAVTRAAGAKIPSSC